MEQIKKTKVCRICGRELPLDSAHFHHSKHTPDGFINECKDCKNQIAKERYHNKDKGLTQKGITRKINKQLLASGQKICSHCGKILPMDSFYEGHTRCKECEQEMEYERSTQLRYKSKLERIVSACESLNVVLTDDIVKVGFLLLSNKSQKTTKKEQLLLVESNNNLDFNVIRQVERKIAKKKDKQLHS